MNIQVLDNLFINIENKNIQMYNHLERTAMISYALARDLNLSNEQRENAYFTGLLHDVGKMYMKEFADENKIYPIMSIGLIQQYEEFNKLCKYILQHNENVDGSGYFKLKMNDIDIVSQIVHLADNYDNCRINKYSHSDSIKFLRKNGGIMFNEQLITPFAKSIIKNQLDLGYEDF